MTHIHLPPKGTKQRKSKKGGIVFAPCVICNQRLWYKEANRLRPGAWVPAGIPTAATYVPDPKG